MPAIVNHDERRQEIAYAVERLVLKSGMQSVTVRAVGKESGFSAAIVGHYFHNKEDLLIFTYLSARHRAEARLERALLADKSLLECLQEILPINAARKMEWKLWFGFWGIITSNPQFEEQCHEGLLEANSLFKRILKAAIRRGEIPANTDCDVHADRFSFVINGIASVVLQAPEQWPAAAQVRSLQTEISLIKSNTIS